jgi:hypothetical protein
MTHVVGIRMGLYNVTLVDCVFDCRHFDGWAK